MKYENIDQYTSYIKREQFEENSRNIISSYKEKEILFYQLIESYIIDLITIFENKINDFSHKSFVYLNIYITQFVNYLYYLINNFSNNIDNNILFVKLKNKLDLITKEYFKKYTLDSLIKLDTLFNSDIWKRVELKDISDLFHIQNLCNKTPFLLIPLLKYDPFSCLYNIDYYKNFELNINILYMCYNKSNNESKDDIENILTILIKEKDETTKSPILNNNNIYLNYNLFLLSKFKSKNNDDYLYNKIIECLTINTTIIKIKADTDLLNITVSSSCYSLITYIIDLFCLSFFFQNHISDIYSNINLMFSFYYISCINAFSEKQYISFLFDDSVYNVSLLAKKTEKLDSFFEIIMFQHKHLLLKNFINESLIELKLFFNKEIEFPSNGSTNSDYNTIKLPELSQDVTSLYTSKNIYNLLIEKIIAYESLSSVIFVLSNIDYLVENLNTKKEDLYDINNYKNKQFLINNNLFMFQTKSFLYTLSCKNLLKSLESNITNKIINFKWKADDKLTMFSEPNFWINDIDLEICSIYEKLDILSMNNLNYTCKSNFVESLVIYLLDIMLNAFSCVKKCNNTGRSLMLTDIKFLKEKIEKNFNFNRLSFIFSTIEIYINSWYSSEEDLVNYVNAGVYNIKNSDINKVYDLKTNYAYYLIHPKPLSGIIISSEVLKSNKKDISKRIESVYQKLITKLNDFYDN